MTREEAFTVYDSGRQATVDVLVAQSARIARLEEQLEELLSDLPDKPRRTCRGCLEKQLKIDRQEDEVKSLRGKLNYREKRANEGYFGASTPSSKKPVKPNTDQRKKKKSGAKPGHKGYGRRGFTPREADRVIPVPVEVGACACGGTLHSRGSKPRSVLDLPLIRPEKLLYIFGRKQCVLCADLVCGRAPGVLPGWLYGNGLVAQTAVMHYVHGIPMGTIEEMLGLPRCSLIDMFHDLAGFFEPVLPLLMEEYRMAPVKHADETPWRTQGQSGYAWVFTSDTVSLFLFRHTRSAKVPLEVLGKQKLPGVLGIDRYVGYSRVPCKVQYCYEHLKRDLEDIVRKFPDEPEVKRFARDVISMLKDAIKLRRRRISDKRFYEKASKLKEKIKAAMEADANHEAIRTYQEIFREKEDKMYHWADDRRVPADNNRAERELRPIVIARKISFGSQSRKGRNTREVLASVLNTLAQRGLHPAEALKAALDRLAVVPDSDRYELLFGETVPLDPLQFPDKQPRTSNDRPLPARPPTPLKKKPLMHRVAAAAVFLLLSLVTAFASHAGPVEAIEVPVPVLGDFDAEPQISTRRTAHPPHGRTGPHKARDGPGHPNRVEPAPYVRCACTANSTRQ